MSRPALEGKVAVVTGAGAGGLGYSFAETVVADGGRAVLIDIDADGVSQAAERLGTPTVVSGIAADVSRRESVERAVSLATERFGRIDAVVAAAALHMPGGYWSGPASDLPEDEWRRILDVNVLGVLNTFVASRSAMAASGGGAMVALSSTASFTAAGAYGVTKLAVRGLVVTLAREFGPDGIRVNGVAPGPATTPAVLSGLADDVFDDFVARQPIGRRLTPRDVVGALRFLCGDDAAMVSGETLVVAGGLQVRSA